MEEVFVECCTQLQVSSAVARTWYARLESLYGESSRHYHTMRHVESMVHLWKEYNHLLDDRQAVLLAIFFHDAIYDARSSTSEDRSAELWREFCADAKMDPALTMTERVDRYIMQTKHHMSCPEDAERDLHFFLDFDLEILGAERERYDRYAAAVRQEYAHVPEPDFRAGRSKVLAIFISKPHLYFTPEFRERCGQAAKANLARELEALKL